MSFYVFISLIILDIQFHEKFINWIIIFIIFYIREIRIRWTIIFRNNISCKNISR